MCKVKNYGILTSISWNSNKWKDDPTSDDLKKSKYGFVVGGGSMHESLNFGNDVYPSENDGYYIAYSPIFNRRPSAESSKNVMIIFFLSTKPDKTKYIVGLYAFPQIGVFDRDSKLHPKFSHYDWGNIKSLSSDIILFDNYLEISNKSIGLLPSGKKISQQGFNYLHDDNVINILNLASNKNTSDVKLQEFLKRFYIYTESFNDAAKIK